MINWHDNNNIGGKPSKLRGCCSFVCRRPFLL